MTRSGLRKFRIVVADAMGVICLLLSVMPYTTAVWGRVSPVLAHGLTGAFGVAFLVQGHVLRRLRLSGVLR